MVLALGLGLGLKKWLLYVSNHPIWCLVSSVTFHLHGYSSTTDIRQTVPLVCIHSLDSAIITRASYVFRCFSLVPTQSPASFHSRPAAAVQLRWNTASNRVVCGVNEPFLAPFQFGTLSLCPPKIWCSSVHPLWELLAHQRPHEKRADKICWLITQLRIVQFRSTLVRRCAIGPPTTKCKEWVRPQILNLYIAITQPWIVLLCS